MALPFPARDGNALRNWQTVGALADLGPVAVFGLRAQEPTPPPHPGIEVWTSSSDRSLTDPATAGALDWMKTEGALPSDQFVSATAIDELSTLLDAFAPDTVVIADFSLHRYVDVVRGRVPAVVLDCHQVESAHTRELADASPPAARLVRSELTRRLLTAESRILPLVDQVWACSASDAAAIGAAHDLARAVEVVPNTVEVTRYWREPSPRAHTIVFPAMFSYPPNQEAGLLLIEEVLPAVAERFEDARLELVGRNPTPVLLDAAAADPRVLVTGAVEDVRPHLASAGALAAPIFGGGGTRLKLLEAFASHLPVVSTAKGVEGLEAEDGRHYLRAEDPGSFVEQVSRLWSDAEETEAMAARAWELVAERFSSTAALRAVTAALHRLGSPR